MYAVIDTETTGFSPRTGDRMLEVAVVQLDRHLRVTGTWSTLLNPGRRWRVNVSGITPRDVASSPAFHEVAEELQHLFDGRVLVAHNLPFDRRFLNAEYVAAGYPEQFAKDEGLCTLSLAKRLLPGQPANLAALSALARVEQSDAHRALDDALVTAEVFAWLHRRQRRAA